MERNESFALKPSINGPVDPISPVSVSQSCNTSIAIIFVGGNINIPEHPKL
jgi:hypothetical protein